MSLTVMHVAGLPMPNKLVAVMRAYVRAASGVLHRSWHSVSLRVVVQPWATAVGQPTATAWVSQAPQIPTLFLFFVCVFFEWRDGEGGGGVVWNWNFACLFV
jgi:hypothetical protein